MKRLVSLICVISVIIAAIIVPAQATVSSMVYLEVASVNQNELVLNLCVCDIAALGIKSFGVYLNYSSNATLIGCDFVKENGTGTTDDFSISGIPYSIVWTSNKDSVGQDKVIAATLTFVLLSPVSESDFEAKLGLDFDNLPTDETGNSIDELISFSGVKIEGGVIPEPPVINAAVPGDVDNSGNVTLSDVSLMLMHIAKWNVELNLVNADVNDDSKVNLSDATLILQYIAEWDVELK